MKNFFRKLALILGAVLVVEGVSAIVNRIWFASPSVIRIDPELGWTFAGWRVQKKGGFVLRFNDWGLRDSFRSPSELRDQTRVLVLGDSVVMAQEVPLEKTFVKLLEKHFNDEGLKTYFIDAGFDGYDLKQEVLRYERDLYRLRPAVILWVVCVNDLQSSEAEHDQYMAQTLEVNMRLRAQKRLRERSSTFLLLKHIIRPPSVQVRDPDKEYLDRALAQGATDDSFARSYFSRLKGDADGIGAKLLVTVSPMRPMVRHKAQYQPMDYKAVQFVKNLCKDLSIPYIRVDEDFFMNENLREDYFVDEVHFSTEGHRWFAKALGDRIGSWIH